MSIRVIIADDHALVVEGLRQLLDPEVAIIGTATSGEEALQLTKALRPDIVLMDAMMPHYDGFDTARHLLQISPESKVIIVSMLAEPIHISEAFRAGAKGYVLKQAVVSDLLDAIREVLLNQRYLSPSITGDVREAIEFPWTKPGGFTVDLTKRQMEVLRLLTQGYSTRAIAEALTIVPKTVEFHKSSIYKKIGVRSPSDLTKFALTHGLTTLNDIP